jgi:uncharacterized membrane protein YfcA
MEKEAKNNTSKDSKYPGYSFQMGVFIFLATYAGLKLDQIIGKHHIFVILFSLISIVLSLYYIIHKEINSKKK